MKKILMSASMIASIAAVAIGGTYAAFSDTATSTGNSFTAGTLNLQVDTLESQTAKFTLTNLKPGDTGFQSWALNNAGSINGKLNLSAATITNNGNLCNEPETKLLVAADADCAGAVIGAAEANGELGASINVVVYVDDNGNGVYDAGTDSLIKNGTLNSLSSPTVVDYALNAGVSKNVRLEWSIPASVGNEIQTDSSNVDVTFSLAQS